MNYIIKKQNTSHLALYISNEFLKSLVKAKVYSYLQFGEESLHENWGYDVKAEGQEYRYRDDIASIASLEELKDLLDYLVNRYGVKSSSDILAQG
jgi:hypothetical protein